MLNRMASEGSEFKWLLGSASLDGIQRGIVPFGPWSDFQCPNMQHEFHFHLSFRLACSSDSIFAFFRLDLGTEPFRMEGLDAQEDVSTMDHFVV